MELEFVIFGLGFKVEGGGGRWEPVLEVVG